MISGFLSGIWLLFALHLDSGSVFPAPLSAQEEKRLLKKMEEGDDQAKNKLIEHNLRLVAHVIKKYYSKNEENEELISVGTIGLIKAIKSYDPAKGVRLATFAARCIDNEVLMYFRGQKKTALDISFDEPIETDSEGNPLTLMDIVCVNDTILDDISKKSQIKRLLRYIKELPDEREKTVLILRYGLNGAPPKTQNEIAEIFGISRSYVSRIETKTLKYLKKRLENEKED